MEFITIHEDDNEKITMPEIVVRLLSKIGEKFFSITKDDLDEVLEKTLEYLQENYFGNGLLTGKQIITSADIARLHRNKNFEVGKYGVVFEDAILTLCDYFDMTEGKLTEQWKSQVETVINLHYKLAYDTQCVVHLFDENYKGVSGFMACVKDKFLIIYYFSVNEDDISYSFPS